MTKPSTPHFDQQYQTHLKHLKLKGLQPKTIDAYARAIRRIGTQSKGPGSFVHTISAKYAAGLRQDGCDCGVACAHTTK